MDSPSPATSKLTQIAAEIAREFFDHPDVSQSHSLLSWQERNRRTTTNILDSSGRQVTGAAKPARQTLEQIQQAVLPDLTAGTLEFTVGRDRSWEFFGASGNPRHLQLREGTPTPDPGILPEPGTDQLTRLRELWLGDAEKFGAGPPASETDLDQLAAELRFPVPPELKALLLVVNGAQVDFTKVDEDAGETTITDNWSLLSATEIARRWGQACNFHRIDAVIDLGAPDATQPRMIHPGWVPFAEDWGGNYLGIDTVPGPGGNAGQIIEFGADSPDGPLPVAHSLVDFLAGQRLPESSVPARARIKLNGERALSPDDVPERAQQLGVFKATAVSSGPISSARRLKSLTVNGADDVDLSDLQELPIQEIKLLNVAAVDLAPLAGHPTLRDLTLGQDVAARSIEVLAQLPALERVALSAELAESGTRALQDHGRIQEIIFAESVPLELATQLGGLFRDVDNEVHRFSGSY